MKIIEGLQSGAVLQRDERHFCCVRFKAEFKGEPKISLGKLEHLKEDLWLLKGLFIGGPYTVTISDDESAETFTDLYVGDVWILAGQSNMEGMGRNTADELAAAANPNPIVRAYRPDKKWVAATPVSHQISLSEDPYIKTFWDNAVETCAVEVSDRPMMFYRGVGPGVYIGKRMLENTDVPQGIVPCAVGGTPIEKWIPSGEDNFYYAALRTMHCAGGNFRGMFWCQGEGNPNWEVYPSQLQSIRDGICKEFDLKELPTVVGQSGHFKAPDAFKTENQYIWSRFREMQRKLPETLEKVITVACNDLSLDDLIHVSSDGHKIFGRRMADAMDHLVTGAGYDEPTIGKITAFKDPCVPDFYNLRIRIDNTNGDLCSNGNPSGFAFKHIEDDEVPTEARISCMTLRRNYVLIRTEMSLNELKKLELWYDFGHRIFCNITDGSGRAILSTGPVSLADL